MNGRNLFTTPFNLIFGKIQFSYVKSIIQLSRRHFFADAKQFELERLYINKKLKKNPENLKKMSCKDKNRENKASFFCSKHFPHQQSYIAFIGFILYKTIGQAWNNTQFPIKKYMLLSLGSFY